MRILVIGGTAFVGRHITQAALDAGHDVTVFNRGKTAPDLFPQATHLTGDRNEDLSALSAGEWAATVDVCAYLPRQVRDLASALGGRGGQHVFISSTSAYEIPVAAGFTEDAPLAGLDDPDTEEVTDLNYGGLKVACERLAAELHAAAGVTIVRPTYVIGPHDRSRRFTWWVERIAAGGDVLAPGPADAPIQVIDAGDMATWIVSMIERGGTGTFHAVSPAPPYGFGAMLEDIAAAVAPAGTRLVWVDREFLLARGVDDVVLPLWPGADVYSDINAADPAAAFATGLAPRPVRQSAAEVHAAEVRAAGSEDRRSDETPGSELGPERAAELLAEWQASQG